MTPNPTEEQTSEAKRYLNADADTRRLLYAKALLERDRLRAALERLWNRRPPDPHSVAANMTYAQEVATICREALDG